MSFSAYVVKPKCFIGFEVCVLTPRLEYIHTEKIGKENEALINQ